MAKTSDLPRYELAYLFWINEYHGVRTKTAVANKFNVSISTIGNWMKKYKWESRYNEEFEQINKEIKRQLQERVLGGCDYFLRGVDMIWDEYVRQICSGELKIDHEAMYNLQTLAAEIQRGKYTDGTNATKSDSVLLDFLTKLGQVVVDGT